MSELDPFGPDDPTAGTVLPLKRNPDGSLAWAVPNALRDAGNSLYDAVTLPGRVAAGAPVSVQDATNFALAVGGGGIGGSSLVDDTGGAVLGSFKGYHGSPYVFEPVEHNPFGEFKNEAIGSGEGNQAYGHGHYVAGNSEVAQGYAKKLGEAKSPTGSGNLYNVEIKPDEHELLDWGKPLSEQSTNVLAGLAKLPEGLTERLGEHAENRGYNSPLDEPSAFTGGEFYRAASHYNVVDDPEVLSEELHKAGIPGIKYLDAASRNKPPEQQTRNYVIFHPSNLRITGRNGEELTPTPGDPFDVKIP